MRFQGLDVLRGIMCSFVMTGHYLMILDKQSKFFPFYETIHLIGFYAMQTFFIHSAFMIMRRFKTHYQFLDKPFKTYYLARFIRIYPLWFIFIILSSVIIFKVDFKYVISNILLYFGFFIAQDGNYNFTKIGWSFFVEEVFYIFFPLVTIFFTTAKRLMGGLIFFTICSFLWVEYFESIGNPNTMATQGFLANFQGMFYGFLLYHYEKKYDFELTGIRLAVYMSLSMLFFTLSINFHYSIAALFMIPNLIVFRNFRPNKYFKFFELMGKYGYGAYLFHIFGIFVLVKMFGFQDPLSIKAVILIITLNIMTFIMAWFSYTYIEVPIMKKFKPQSA